MSYRIGHGFDLHRFSETGTQVMIAGVAVPHNRGIIAHSDGDVAIHALCDALLGAVALGDIGQHFPDTDLQYQNKDSAFFLEKVVSLIQHEGYHISNIDMTVITQKPRLRPHVESMQKRLSTLCRIEPNQLSIKGKTFEGVDAIGREEALAAHAVVLVYKKES